MSTGGTLSFVFTDLVDHTATAQRLGDEEFDRRRRRHFAALRSAVAEHGGREVKNLGDGLMVVFGQASDAIACAIAMQQTTALPMRVGVHAGDVSIEGDDYFGTPVTIAKRLCDAGSAGEILCSDLVRALVGSRRGFSFTPRGSLDLKGLGEPVPACAVDWAAAGPALPGPLRAGESAFVGREAEVESLRAAWAKADGDATTTVAVAGEPGIGKTRLIAHFASEVAMRGALVLYGRSDEDAALPYQPFLDALRPHPDAESVVIAPSATGARAAPLGDSAIADVTGEDTSRGAFYESIAVAIEHMTSRQPVLLVLDDLHWADKPTLVLLRHLTRRGIAGPVLIVLTYRETDLGRTHPLAEVLADLRRDRLVQRISLLGLTGEEVGRMMEGASGPVAPPVATAVWRETEGNPFFVEEVVRHLAESGADLSSADAVERLGIPEGVREVVGRRLSRLSESCNRVLKMASVVGRDFDLRVLAGVSEISETDLLDALDEAREARVVAETDVVDRWTFSHALIRQTLYEELSTSRRVRLHRRIGEVMEHIYAGALDDHMAALATHFMEAAIDPEATSRAVEYARKAGDKAVSSLAFEEGIRWYEVALDLVEDDLSMRGRFLHRIGHALGQMTEVQANAILLEAVEIGRRLGDDDLLIAAATDYYYAWDGSDAAGERLMDDALAALGDGDSPSRAILLAYQAHRPGSPEGRISMARQAVAMAKRTGDFVATQTALRLLHGMLAAPEYAAERLAIVDEIRARAAAEGLDHWRFTQVSYVVGLLELGRIPEACTEIETVAPMVERAKVIGAIAWVMQARAGLELMEGRFGAAEQLAREARRYFRDKQVGIVPELNFGAQIFLIRREQGRLVEIEESVMRTADTVGLPVLIAGAALMLADLGRDDEAALMIERVAADGFSSVPRDRTWVATMALISEPVAHLGDADKAAPLYELLLPCRDVNAIVGNGAVMYGAVSRYLGLLAATLGRHDEAAGHFAHALDFNARMGARPWLARTRLDQARLLRAMGEHGGATGLARSALAEAEDMRMPVLAGRARALVAETEPG